MARSHVGLGSFASFRPALGVSGLHLNSGHISVESVGCFEWRRARHEDNEELTEETNGFRHRSANGRRFLEGHQGSRGARLHPCLVLDAERRLLRRHGRGGREHQARIRLGTGVMCSARSSGVCCGRRVTKLYSARRLFACRNCYRLTYASQQESALHRGLGKSQKIRMRLGESANMSEEFPDKPKGMHWRTYERLRWVHDVAEERSNISLTSLVEGPCRGHSGA